MTEKMNGILYSKPKAFLLHDTGIGVPEIAARTCYDSFDMSENDLVKTFPMAINSYDLEDGCDEWKEYTEKLGKTEESGLLHDLAWTYHHHSILEHTYLSFYINGTSRAVLQEHARHRMQNISVRSTRYTMGDIINIFIASLALGDLEAKGWFINRILELNMFVTIDNRYNAIEAGNMFDKLFFQYIEIGSEEFLNISLSKENLENFKKFEDAEELLKALREGKKKRNVGDSFKHIVSDNWKVDLVVTFNLRSLKNYFDLRNSGAAWFQIRWLAQEMTKQIPEKYLKLIDKKYR